MMKIARFVFNAFQENTYVLYDKNKVAVIVDPGCYDRYEEEMLFKFIKQNELKVAGIMNTHAHIDHVLGVHEVMKMYQCPFLLHKDDVEGLKRVQEYSKVYGFSGYKPAYEPTELLEDGDVLTFGDMRFEVIHAPGHSPGHVVFYNRKEKVLVNGDVLFKGSFGRTDLPGGDMDVLKNTIKNKLFHLPSDTLVLCGHGADTTIGEEKKTNYILQF
ncbi:MAG: MBL fold metallo-hydrolase [Crocinitomicaceae bacterium]|jgi:glyoxylase-like metal-dependent hydrolase (beta-lactamase superfamily II)|nr:MBL fold metallo-hydrolase [Crocinitomicaceae bacterium]